MRVTAAVRNMTLAQAKMRLAQMVSLLVRDYPRMSYSDVQLVRQRLDRLRLHNIKTWECVHLRAQAIWFCAKSVAHVLNKDNLHAIRAIGDQLVEVLDYHLSLRDAQRQKDRAAEAQALPATGT